MKRSVWSWCLFDFASSPFTSIVVTFLYPAYFATTIAGDESWGGNLWVWAICAEGITVSLFAPLLGAWADRSALRKRFVLLCVVFSATFTVALGGVPKGYPLFALVLFYFASVLFELASGFYNAFLPAVASKEQLGRISGYGWGLGYFGELLALLVVVGLIGIPEAGVGFLMTPVFPKLSGNAVPISLVLTAVWMVVFSIPFFLWVPEPPASRALSVGPLRTLRATAAELRRRPDSLRFLIAHLIYNDGLATIFAMSGLYASARFGMPVGEIVLFGTWITITAGVGAWLLGRFDDRLGSKTTLMITLVVLAGATAMAAFATHKTHYWIAGTAIGFMIGPNQSASRSFMAKLSPSGREAEFFGLFALSGKATSWMGSFLFGTVSMVTGSQRWAVLSIAALFGAGLLGLTWVKEPTVESAPSAHGEEREIP